MPSKAERIREAIETPALSAISRMACASSSVKRAESDTGRFLFSEPLRASGSLLSLVRGCGSLVVIQQRNVGPWLRSRCRWKSPSLGRWGSKGRGEVSLWAMSFQRESEVSQWASSNGETLVAGMQRGCDKPPCRDGADSPRTSCTHLYSIMREFH